MIFSATKNTLFFILLITFLSCKEKAPNTTSATKQTIQKTKLIYAKGFTVKNFKGYTKLTVTAPYPKSTTLFTYYLVPKNNPIPKKIKNKNIIRTPIKKIVVTSTTHIPMLELLHEENSLVGFPNCKYVSSKKTRHLIDNRKVKEIGKNEDLNTEILITLQPELVIGFAMNSNNKTFNVIRKLGIPVIINGDWLEETPLGKAEWIKFFALFFEKEKQANIVFNNIKSDYLDAKEIAKKAKETPSILSGVQYNEAWNLPAGKSFVAQLLKDANTNYLWKKNNQKGSLSLSFESVFDKAKNADYWVSPGYFANKQQLLEQNKKYANFKAFKNGNIYTFANTKGKTGGVLFYEIATTRPDLVLKDLIKITHPKLLPKYEFTFYQKMK